MFKIKNIHTGEIHAVYGVRMSDFGITIFLIYHQRDQRWMWESSIDYIPW